MSIVGENFARVGVTLSQNGLGYTWFNGAGNMDLIYVPSFVTQVVRVQFGMGAEVFLGSGWYTNVNNTRWSHQVVNAGFPGYEVGGMRDAGVRVYVCVCIYRDMRLCPLLIRPDISIYLSHQGWIGLGGAVFIRSRTYSRRVVNYRVRPFLWVVNGRGVAGGQYSNNNLLVTKDGITVLKPQPTPKPKPPQRSLGQ